MKNHMKGAGVLILAGITLSIAWVYTAPGTDSVRASGPPNSSNSIAAQPGTSAALASVLTRSCGDCHSQTMATRWYTRTPPFSALMARSAREGRKALDFSQWSRYSGEQQRTLLLASCSDAMTGKMPMEAYLRFRSDARLSASDIRTICDAAAQRSRER
jgi:hypothetical protein